MNPDHTHRGAVACSCGWHKPGHDTNSNPIDRRAPLIGLIGRKRAGKDSFAAELVDRHGFVRVAFADALRAVLYDLDPIVKIETDESGPLRPEIATDGYGLRGMARLAWLVDAVGWERAKALREVRRLMQAHGVAIREHVGENVWVDAAMDRVADFRRGTFRLRESGCGFERTAPTPVVVTDVRFPNEAEAIKAAGGKLVRIVRLGQDLSDTHISETALDGWPVDREVFNAGTLEDLQRHADAAVEMLFTPR